MDIPEVDARVLLKAMGSQVHDKTLGVVEKTVNRIPAMLDISEEVSEDQEVTIKRVCFAISEGEKVRVVPTEGDEEVVSDEETQVLDVDEDQDEQVETKPKKKKGRPPSKEKAEKKEKESVEKDRFGAKLGTDCSKAHACLGTEPKTARQIQQEAGIKTSVEYRLDKLVRLGLLKWKKGEGYFIPSKAK